MPNTGSIDGSGPGGIEAGSAHGLTNQVEDEDKKEDEKGSDEEMRRAEEMREVKMPMVQAHDTHTNVIMASASAILTRPILFSFSQPKSNHVTRKCSSLQLSFFIIHLFIYLLF